MIKSKRLECQTYLNLRKLRLLDDCIFLVEDKLLKCRVLMSDRILHFSVKTEKRERERERVRVSRQNSIRDKRRDVPNEINAPSSVKKIPIFYIVIREKTIIRLPSISAVLHGVINYFVSRRCNSFYAIVGHFSRCENFDALLLYMKVHEQ